MAHILLVEDDAWIADCYQLWLQQDGHQVVCSHDAQAALDAADETKPDVVLLDLFLPFANGLQLLHTLRSHADLAAIPVILCSSALHDPLPDLRAYGVCATLDKTVLTARQLRQAVKGVLDHAAV